MKVFCDIEFAWRTALLQKENGCKEEDIQRNINRAVDYALGHFCEELMSQISDEKNHIVKLLKEYWTEEKTYSLGLNLDFSDTCIEYLKSLNPYDVYFMIDEENQLEEARDLLFPKDSFSMSVLKYDYKDSKITEKTYHRNCATCLYYEGSRRCPGHAPCSYWGKGTMFNDYCSRWEENILKST